MINFYCLNSYINISQQIYITSHHLHKFTVRRQYNSYALPTFFCFSFAQFLVFHTFLRNYIFSFKLSFIYLTYISLCIHYIQFFFYSLEYNTFIKLIGEKYLKWHAIIYKHVFFFCCFRCCYFPPQRKRQAYWQQIYYNDNKINK